MERYTYNLGDEFTTDQYRELLKFASRYCTAFQLTVLDSIGVNESAVAVLDRLKPFSISRTNESEWFGTKLLEETATVFRFTLSSETAEILGNVAVTLFSWMQPELPEDLCLVRQDGEPFLVTISHEKDGYLILSPYEKTMLDAEVPDILVTS